MYDRPDFLALAKRELLRLRVCSAGRCEGDLKPSGSVAVKCPAGSDGDLERLVCADCGAVYYD